MMPSTNRIERHWIPKQVAETAFATVDQYPLASTFTLFGIGLGVGVALGMLLIVAFSIGLAGVLTGIGMLLVYARRLFEHFPTDGRLLRALPVASAAVVTLAGLGITLQALLQAGVLRI